MHSRVYSSIASLSVCVPVFTLILVFSFIITEELSDCECQVSVNILLDSDKLTVSETLSKALLIHSLKCEFSDLSKAILNFVWFYCFFLIIC